MTKDEFISLDDAAKIIGCSRQSIYRRLLRSDVPKYALPEDQRKVVVRRKDVEIAAQHIPYHRNTRSE